MLESEFAAPFREVLDCESPEGYPEIRAVEGVDEGVDCRVDPPKPGQIAHHDRIAVGQERQQDVVDEERKPANYEAADDNAQRLGGFGLSPKRRNLMNSKISRDISHLIWHIS